MKSDDMELIERYMPRYDVRTRHAVLVRAPADTCYAALRETDLFAPWIVRALFALRVLPARIGRRSPPRPRVRTLHDLERGGAVLAVAPGREVVFGLIGRFWALRQRSHHPIDPATFADLREPGLAKAVIGFAADPVDALTTTLSTETRVWCMDASSRRRFRVYWAVIDPFSGLTRIVWLNAVRAAAEGRAGTI